jgi:AraC-like DNA-binding protein
MSLAAALLPPLQLQRLHQAVRSQYVIEACDDWIALTRTCELRPVQLAVVDLYVDGAPNFERLRVLKRRFPTLALVAYVTANAQRARDLFDAGRVGVDGLVLVDVDDEPGMLMTTLEQAEARGLTSLLRAALAARGQPVRPLVRDAVLASVVRAHERLTPTALARLLAVPSRVLSRRLAEAGMPAPNKLLTWGRLLVAARLLEDGARSADGVALALAFPSGSACRNTSQRYLSATPGEIRARGGSSWVIERFIGVTAPPRAEESAEATPPDDDDVAA